MQSKLLNDTDQKTYAVILQSGEEVNENILLFARQHKIKAAQFTAIGAVSKATLGFFDFSIKDYKKIEIHEQAEVLMLAGDISLFNNGPKVHAHIVLGKADGTAHGGHLLKATVHPTLEIILTESPAFLERKMDKETGLPLIKI
ncbi:MAG TPA: PPC domain-containing DNA-binding protein [Chitinophagaceae bacterium]